ncbi:Mitochondrial import inner membrane translocase subunit tim44 [Trichoderma ghanense]|uniref:Mitochondrial import inner membrane translocase subunit tim44 n=1 Tax=Trichoderma ghanense TaxID=65468 RepID=A0ABY2H4E5_9HYPO
MNSLARSAANSQSGLSRASLRLAPACSPSPAAYARLASQLAQRPGRNAASVERAALPSALSTPLRSSFLPAGLRVASAASQSRSLHVSGRRLQEDTVKTEAKPAADKAEPKAKVEEEPTKDSEEKTDGKEEAKEDGKDEGKEKKEDLPPPPPHGDKTPWQVFMETMNTELQKSQEWNESTKQIAASANQFAESESVRRAREAYEKSTGAISQTTSKVAKTTATAIGKGAAWTWETPVMKGVRKAANVTGDAVDKATKPIRETEAFKNVKNVIDDGSSSRYGGWVEKEERRKRREQLAKERGEDEVLQEDPNAGTNITLHKDAAWKEAWRDFRDSNKFVQSVFSMKGKYEESENPLISTARSITDTIGGFFAENETAMVIKKFRSMDPSFRTEPFLQELREYILPEVLDAYVKGDTEVLKQWLSAAQFSVYEALTKQYLQAGMKSDGRILDIRNVDILKARMLDPGEIPVFIITCRTQEVHVYRNAKTNELAAGMEDRVQQVTYAIGITRVPEDVNNPETRGWRLIEMQKSGRDWV